LSGSEAATIGEPVLKPWGLTNDQIPSCLILLLFECVGEDLRYVDVEVDSCRAGETALSVSGEVALTMTKEGAIFNGRGAEKFGSNCYTQF